MLTCLAVIFVGVWLILQSQGPLESTVTLIFGLVVAILALVDFLGLQGIGPRSPRA